MKVLIQRLSSGLFLKGQQDWALDKEDARVFPGSAAAMQFCIQRNIENVGLLFVFDSGTELLLNVFDRTDLIKAVARAMEANTRLQEESRVLIAEMDQIIAESKERRKQYRFKPPGVRNPPGELE